MSYLWNSNAQAVDETRLKEAELQYDSMALLYKRIISACEAKCVYRYGEPDLTKGELACIDRCTVKYMTANQTVGLKVKEMGIDPMATNAALVGAERRLNEQIN